MKNCKLLITSLLLLSSNIFAQKFVNKIFYEVKSIDINLSNEKISNTFIEDVIKEAKNQTFTLMFNEFRSFFYSNSNNMTLDQRGTLINKLASIGFTSSFNYYYDKASNTSYFDRRNGVIIKESNIDKAWEITTEHKLIDSYLCYKAIYKYHYKSNMKMKTRDIAAWFAPSLPYNYGPKDYHGLPGLILELEDNKVTFLATKIEFSDKEVEIMLPKGKTITKEEHEKIIFSN